jgi:hypothetical protein
MKLGSTAPGDDIPRRAARDVLVAAGIKLALLAIIYALFFSSAHRVESDAPATAAALLGLPTPERSR